LDLRAIPKSGPVAEWWQAAHLTRSIGAVYSEANGESYLVNAHAPRDYDVLLFVEKTTAARGN
jgi:erythromycin esterase